MTNMTKKLIALLLAVLAIAGVASACVPGGNQSSTPTGQSGSAALPALKTTDTPNLYSLTTGKVAYTGQQVRVTPSGSLVGVEYINSGMDSFSETVCLISPIDDKVLNTVELGDGLYHTGALDNGFFIAYGQTGDVEMFGDNGKKESTMNIKDFSDYSQLIAISPDGAYALYCDGIEANLILYTFADGSKKTVYKSDGRICDWSYLTYDSGFVLLDSANDIVQIDPSLGHYETVARGMEGSEHSGTHLFFTDEKGVCLTPVADPAKPFSVSGTGGEQAIASDSNYLITRSDSDESKLSFFDLDNKTALQTVSIGSRVESAAVFGRYAVIATQNDSCSEIELYLFDLAASDTQGEITLGEVTVTPVRMPEWSGSEQTVSAAKKVLDDHNVRIVYDYDAIDLSGASYSYEASPESEIASKIDVIADFLQDFFPEGMLDEIGDGKEIWIFLCRELSGDLSLSVEGLAMYYDGYPFIAIESNGTDPYFCETLAHEFSHLIDYRLGGDWFEKWTDSMPQEVLEDAYLNTYETAGLDELKYTPYDQTTDNVWFFSQYSRTFPGEDRAVIFEKLYISYAQGELADNFAFENVKNKGKLYCEMLRANFESCKNAGELKWETVLD